ncbi:SRPBCC family protein [Mycobacterium sp. NPDC050041]|uniref:SRPBCC family protein n=1 Tax=Mycobacterium sp. NPDC050041 TaxID=3364293 RepID=UPI003C2E3320
MAHGTASVVIAHPAQVVWDYIVDPDYTSNVLPGIVAVRAEKRPPYVPGDVWHGTARMFGITYEWTGVFTRFEPPRVMEFRSTKSRFPFVTIDTLEEVPGGTRYTCQATGEPAFGGPVGRLLDAAMSTAYQRVLARHLARLPAHVDGWAVNRR